MKIAYLTWGETPRSYGVFGSQVLGQFIETKKEMPNDEFYFISAVPIIHSGLVREKLAYSKELKKIRKKLGIIKFLWIPIYTTQNFVNSNKLTFKLMHIIAHWYLKNHLKNIKPDIVHCRSYHAAWAALKVKEKYEFDYKIVFDGRGLWPEEIALKQNFSQDGKDYLFLKSIEKELLQKSDVCVAVSDTMMKHYEQLSARKIECIYLSASTDKLAPTTFTEKQKDEIISFCYVGALSEDTWHQPAQLLSLYHHVRSIVQKTRLIIVTTSNHDAIQEYFREIPENEITLTSIKSVEELKSILEKADFGILSYFVPSTIREELLGSMVLAVKTAEYLAAGLPVLVNDACGGAAHIVNKNQLGIAYNPSTFSELTQESIQIFLSKDKNQISNTAKSLFDYQNNAMKYAEIYRNTVK